MTVRAQESEVRNLTGVVAATPVTLYITQANLLVNEELLTQGYSEGRLGLIETYLAAHFCILANERGSLASTSIGESKDSFHNTYTKGLGSTRFGQQAISFDTSGKLANMSAVSGLPPVRQAEFKVV